MAKTKNKKQIHIPRNETNKTRQNKTNKKHTMQIENEKIHASKKKQSNEIHQIFRR